MLPLLVQYSVHSSYHHAEAAIPHLQNYSKQQIQLFTMSNMIIVIFGLLSLHVPACRAVTDSISAGQGLSGNNTLVSSNGKFALGFFQPFSKSSSPDASKWYLGIWFNTVPKFTPAWVANGDKPVSGPTSPELTISDDGNLVIIDQATKSIIWSTQANTTANSTRAMLLKTGNLVLQSTSNTSHTLWQSFDYPTDTHLAGAKLGRDKVTGLNRRLVSRKNLIDPASGMYTYELHEKNGSARFSLAALNSSVPYWSSGEWNGHYFGSIPEMSGRQLIDFTFVNNEQEVYFTYTLLDDATIMRFSLNISGQVKILLWVEHAQEWVTAFTNPNGQCDVYGICGPFTTCGENKLPYCSCMEGFSITSPDDWGLEDRTGGCMRNTPLDSGINNSTSKQDWFYPMPCVSFPDNGQKIGYATTASGCAQVCLGNYNCTAYSNGNNGCFVWDDKLTNVKQQQCGDFGNNNQTILYLRLADKEVQRMGSNRRPIIIGIAIGASVALFAILSLLLLKSRRMCAHRTNNLQHDGGIILFRYADLQCATNNFSEKLGTGGFGSVFKGFMNDSSAIAVKRLDGAHQGEKQFRAEVRSIGTIQHINLVKLIGFCTEGDSRLLVYEYMQNRSLDSHLFDSNATGLNWSIRYQIALGVARGLVYLHDNCRDCIIHCDIKPENILLDASFVPKIADFGMAKLLGRDFSRVITTMRGTIGYLAPEWLSGTVITAKVDVYSYGMVLLEILSGRRNSGRQYTTGDAYEYFPVKVANKLLEGGVGSLVDNNIPGDVHLEQVERAFKVACWCIQDDEFDRPTMGQVVQYLEGLLEVDVPPMPRLLQAIAANALSNSEWYLDRASQESGKLKDAEGSAQHQVAQP